MNLSFLQIENKVFFITGVSNKKSIAYFCAKTLHEFGAILYFSVQNEEQQKFISQQFKDCHVFICDVSKVEDLQLLKSQLSGLKKIDGLLHSIAFANFSDGPKPFHQTKRSDYLQACQISSFSLVEICEALREQFNKDASVVTLSISTTRATSYGYLGPIKAMLNSTIDFLAKSFSEFSEIRFNAVGAGPLKTSASAGIPDYIDNYIYSELLTLRKRAIATQEVANTVCFLLSPRSSGINASIITVDAGMSCNYFDQKIVKQVAKST